MYDEIVFIYKVKVAFEYKMQDTFIFMYMAKSNFTWDSGDMPRDMSK